jgi:hypothetical protein
LNVKEKSKKQIEGRSGYRVKKLEEARGLKRKGKKLKEPWRIGLKNEKKLERCLTILKSSIF